MNHLDSEWRSGLVGGQARWRAGPCAQRSLDPREGGREQLERKERQRAGLSIEGRGGVGGGQRKHTDQTRRANVPRRVPRGWGAHPGSCGGGGQEESRERNTQRDRERSRPGEKTAVWGTGVLEEPAAGPSFPGEMRGGSPHALGSQRVWRKQKRNMKLFSPEGFQLLGTPGSGGCGALE